MTFQIRQAERRKARLRLALVAPAGAGKTLSGLLIAYGLTGDWGRVGLIDTENGSGELYAGTTVAGVTIGGYQYGRLAAPFTVEKYLDAIHAFEAALGPEGVVLVDSLSHAWAAEGGLLERVDTIAGRGNKWAAWRDVTPLHNQLVEAMLQSPSHIIATMRTKAEYVVEDDDRGKKVPKKVGLAPVQREGLDYEFTVVLDLDAKHVASASKDRTGLFDGVLAKPTPEMGQRLKAWLDRGVEAPPPPTRPAPAAPPNGASAPTPGGMTPEQLARIRDLRGQLGFPTLNADLRDYFQMVTRGPVKRWSDVPADTAALTIEHLEADLAGREPGDEPAQGDLIDAPRRVGV